MPWPWQRKKKKVPKPRTDSGRPIPQPAWDERGWVTYMMGDPVEFSSADNSGYVYAVQDKRYRPLDPGAVRVKDGATGTVTAIGDDKLAVMVPEDAREIDPTLHPMKQKGLATGPLIFSRADLVNLKLENERKWARKADVVWLNNLTRTAMAVRPESGPPTPWGYHITPMQNYRWNTGGKIFISGPTAISHWHHIVDSRFVDEEQLHRPEQWDPTIDDFEEPEWMQRRRQARHAHCDYHEVAQDDEAYAIIDETGIGDTYWSRSAAAIRMDPEALRRAEDWIRKMLSRVAYGVASEALEKREEFAADLERRKDLAETELDSARQDAADGDPVTIFMGLAEPGEPAVVRVVPADPESGEEWQVDWESRPSGEIKTLKYGSLQELNAWLVSMAETQFSRVQKIDPAQQAEKVTLGQATVRALEEQAEGKTATLPLFGRIDLGTINGVPVGEVPVTLEESMRVGGAYYAGGPGSQPRMLLEIGPAPWSLKKVEERIPALVEVFEHEAVHGFQHASRPADDSYRPGIAGPTFDGVTDTRSAPDDVAHASADIEFYPRIVSEVHSFLRSGDTSNEAARRWVENQTTFTALDGPKWQKAVKVFFQEIDKARSRAAQRNDDMIKWEKAGQTEEAPSAPVYDSYEDLVEALGREPEVLDVMDGTPGPEPGTIYYDDEDLGRTVLLTLYADIDPEELDNTEAVPVFDLYTYARDVAMAEAVTAPTLDGFVLMDDENARERILPLSPSLTAPEGGDEDDDIEWERQAQFNDTTDDEEVDDLDLVGDPMAQRLDQAHDASAEIAQKTGQDFERTVGVVAALSPNMKWAANLKAAEMLLQNPEYYRRAALNRVRGLAPINAAKADALKPVADERRAAEKAAAAKIGQEKAALLAELAQPGVKVTQKAIKDGKFGPEAKKRLADIIRRTEAAKKAAAEPFKAKEKEIRESFQPEIDAVNQANPFTGVPQYTKNVLKALDVIAINIYRGDPDAPLTEMRSLSEPERRKILRAYKQVAKEYGLLPQEVQAITWSIWREMKKKQNRPAEPQKKQPKQPKQQESFNFEGQDLSWSEIPVIKGRPVEEDDEGDDLPEWLEDVRIHDRPEDAPPKEKGRMFIGTVWEEARAA